MNELIVTDGDRTLDRLVRCWACLHVFPESDLRHTGNIGDGDEYYGCPKCGKNVFYECACCPKLNPYICRTKRMVKPHNAESEVSE